MLNIYNWKETTIVSDAYMPRFPNYEGERIEYIFPKDTSWRTAAQTVMEFHQILQDYKILEMFKSKYAEINETR